MGGGFAAYTAPGSAGLSAGSPRGAHGGPHGASRIARQPGGPYRSPAKALSAADRMRCAAAVVHPILRDITPPGCTPPSDAYRMRVAASQERTAAPVGREEPPVVTLLTDFGSRDAYAAVMKGVILRSLPTARLVDVTHEVPPQGVRAAAFVLESACPYFPDGTVHVVVVDPGVGGPRRIIAAEAGGCRFLGPDNGVLSVALERVARGPKEPCVVAVSDEAVHLARRRALPPGATESTTFHGRDRFAPLAAELARGTALE